MLSPQQLRIITTTIILILFKFYNTNLLSVLLALFLLDFLDCSTITNKLFYPDYKCLRKYKSDSVHKKEYEDYQKKDKIIDLFAYFLALVLFHNLLDNKVILIYIVLFLWRTIGVIKYVRTNNPKYLKIFFDGINGLLALAVFSSHFNIIKNNFDIALIPVMFSKIIFENIYH